jgi:hypothetical protein
MVMIKTFWHYIELLSGINPGIDELPLKFIKATLTAKT